MVCKVISYNITGLNILLQLIKSNTTCTSITCTYNNQNNDILLTSEHSLDLSQEFTLPVVDGRVDWSQTFAGIEQPNEAYSLVLKKNEAYENTRRQRNRQRVLVNQQPQPSLTSPLVLGERTTEEQHQYEQVLPPVTSQLVLGERATEEQHQYEQVLSPATSQLVLGERDTEEQHQYEHVSLPPATIQLVLGETEGQLDINTSKF